MKTVVTLLLLTLAVVDPISIGRINTLKREARAAYTAGDYKTAIAKYRVLVDSLDVPEDEVMLNLANAYFNANDSAQALSTYQSIAGSPKAAIRSKAQQQMGIMNHRAGRLEEALNNFKQAIKADPSNRDARYNYEMLKKKLDEQQKKDQQQNQQNRDKDNKENQNKDKQKNEQQKQDQQNKEDQQKKDEQQKKEQEQKDQQQKDQQQKDQQSKDQEQKDKEQQEKEQKEKQQGKPDEKENADQQDKNEKQPPPQLSEKLQQMKISEEKARMILEAMKNQEKQYLQQNQRKATKPRDKGKPDW